MMFIELVDLNFYLYRVEKSDQDIKEVPVIMVTPASDESKKRRPANLVTSWGPNVVKAKLKMNNKEVNMPHKGIQNRAG